MATPAFDNAQTGAAGVGASLTYSKTNGASTTLLLVGVTISAYSASIAGRTVGVTYNGVALTEIRSGTSTGTPLSSSSASAGLCLFYLFTPATGANNVVVTVTGGNVDSILADAVSYTNATGVNNSGSTTSNGATNSPNLVITSATGDLVFATASHGDTISGGGTGTTVRGTLNNSAFSAGDNIIGGEEAGAASVTISFTSSVNDHWVLIGLNMTGGAAAKAPPFKRERPALTFR